MNTESLPPVSVTAGQVRDQASPHFIERWYVLILTVLIYAINIADRYVVSTVLEQIRLEWKLSNGEVAILTSTPLAFFYVFFGMLISWLADRTNRRNILAISLVTWSAFTVLCGRAVGYWQFFWARIGVGIGEAGGTPPSTAIVSDYFPPPRRPMAMTVLGLGAPIGAWLGANFAGAVANEHGWRMAFVALGLPGLVVGILVYLTVKEPPRGRLDPCARTEKASFFKATSFLWEQRAAFHVVMGGGLCALWGWGLIFWTPAFLQRAYGLNVAEAGAITGNIHLWGGLFATAATAAIFGSKAMANSKRIVWFLTAGIALATIPSFIAYFTHDLSVCKWMFVLFIPAIYFYIGPCFGLLNNLSPCNMRNTFIAWSLLVANIFNLVVAPQGVGFLTDWFMAHGQNLAEATRTALLWLAPTGFWAAFHLYLASRTIIKDEQRANG